MYVELFKRSLTCWYSTCLNIVLVLLNNWKALPTSIRASRCVERLVYVFVKNNVLDMLFDWLSFCWTLVGRLFEGVRCGMVCSMLVEA